MASYNSDGSLDSTFSEDGLVTTDLVGSTENYAYSIAIQGDKILIAGQTAIRDSLGYMHDGFAVVRYNKDGSLDPVFGKDGSVYTDLGFFEAALSIVIQNDKIVVAGSIYNQRDNDLAIVRYNSDGSLDPTFNANGHVTGYYPSGETYFTSAVMQGDKTVVAGYINNNIIGGNTFAFARYNPDGSLDPTFSGNGLVTTDFIGFSATATSITIEGDKIVVAGYTYPLSNFAVARYNSDGSLDSTFSQDGLVTTDFHGWDDIAQSVAIQNNKIVVAGSSYDPNTFHNDFAIARYNPDGSLDSTFDGDGLVTTDFAGSDDNAQSIVVQDDKIIAAGTTTGPFSFDHNFAIARYNSEGSLDSTFSDDGLVTTNFGSSGNFAQ